VLTERLLIVVVALFALASCATRDREARPSEPHAIIRFQRNHIFSFGPSAWPLEFNGVAPRLPLLGTQRTYRIYAGPTKIRVGDTYECLLCGGTSPYYVCDLSFEAEAGEHYFVSAAETEDKTDDAYIYAVTDDMGVKVAECVSP
jgi:hypothetical protein